MCPGRAYSLVEKKTARNIVKSVLKEIIESSARRIRRAYSTDYRSVRENPIGRRNDPIKIPPRQLLVSY